jgi:quinoprotein glucose dehydrogenase
MLPALIAVALFATAPASGREQWGDRGGTRFSPLAQITPANVGNLVRAWEFRTGDLDTRAPAAMAHTKFQASPLFVEDSIIFCSPFNEVIALIPATARRSGDTIQDQHQSAVRCGADAAAS